MLIPVRCFTCGKMISDKFEEYEKELTRKKLALNSDEDPLIIDINADEIKKLISLVKSQDGVEDFIQNSLYGDYLAFTLVLKANKDKAWFISFFKKVGLPFIRINHNEEIPVEKM